MTADRARLLREWFEAACDLPEAEWVSFLEGCGDPSLRAEVLDLLRRDRVAVLPLDVPAAHRDALLALACDAPLPARIGGYEVVRVIGRGSMGTVYEARASGGGPHVAVKVLRMGLPTRALLHRFRREAEILARLDHPCIARILESGTTELGVSTLPFIAMELVSGRPLDVYCDEERLDLRARLDLLARIGEGVEHAHRRGVVHRDLKPSNILVDAEGRPRLLDFGVARTTWPAGGNASLRTATGQLVGTLQSMSPEQTLGDPSAVDARSDVYALGAVAYALLAGRPPYDVGGCSFDEALRRIRHEDPPRLGVHRRELRGAVEVVVAHALEKERADRYPTAQAFVDDLHALLDGRPSAARPPGILQLARRFARRDPRAFRAAAAFVALLLLGIAGTSWGWIEAERSAAATQAAYRESESVVSFLESVFHAVRPGELGPRVLLADALLLASPRVDEELAEQPEIAGRVHRTLGSAFYAVALPERALQHLDAAERLAESLSEADPGSLLRTRFARALVFIEQARFDEAVDLLNGVCAQVPEGDIELRAKAARELARALSLGGDSAAAAARLASLLDGEGRVPGAPAAIDEGVRLDLANLASLRGETEPAEETMRAVLQARTERLGPDHDDTLAACAHLAELLARTGRTDEAEALHVRRVQALTKLLGAEHPHTLYARGRLALLLTEVDRSAEVMSELDRLVASSRRVLGDDHPRTASLLCTRSVAALHTGRPDAPALIDEALLVGRKALGDDHPHLVTMLSNAGTLRMRDGKMEEGAELLREALVLCERTGGARALDLLLVQVNLAGALMSLGRSEEARPITEDALARSRAVQGDSHPQTLTLIAYMASFCAQSDELPRARALYEEILASGVPPTNPVLIHSQGNLGTVLLELGERDEGEALLRATLAEAERRFGADSVLAVYCRNALASLPAKDS